MNSPQPDPTPPLPVVGGALPTLGGMIQGLVTAWGAWRVGRWAGLTPDSATALAGAAVSAVTSGLHKLAVRFHWAK